MARNTWFQLAAAALAGMGWVQSSRAQNPDVPAAPPAAPTVLQPDVLPGLPHLPEQPRSLFTPGAGPGGTCAPLPGPYFEPDAYLDPPELPSPGWFAALDPGADGVHVKNHVALTSTPTGNNVVVPFTPLDWNFAAKIQAGFRLPEGFGEFGVSYRFVGTEGNGLGAGLDGPATLRSRFDMNELDLDYASREFSLWPCWDMQWRVGLRIDWLYFDAAADESPVLAAANPFGSNPAAIFEQRFSNSYVGTGPHAGLELARRLPRYGLSLVAGCDFAIELGRVRQGVFEVSALPGAGGETRLSSSDGAPQARFDAGVRWQPPGSRAVSVFAGYHYDYFWNAGRIGSVNAVAVTPADSADVIDQGFLVRLAYNF
jgi:hypothetical protein